MDRQSERLAGCEVAWSAGEISVSGEIDLGNATAIEQRICVLLGAEIVVVDCRAVTFLDVAGLRMLARVGAAAGAADAIVHLRCSRAVIETLSYCGLHDLPGVVLSRDDNDSSGGLR